MSLFSMLRASQTPHYNHFVALCYVRVEVIHRIKFLRYYLKASLRRDLLIAPDGPAWDGFAAKEFQVGTWRELLNAITGDVGLGAVAPPWGREPGDQILLLRRQIATYTEQAQFVAETPVVPHTHGRLRPDQLAFMREAPGLQDLRAGKQEGAGGPEMQMRL